MYITDSDKAAEPDAANVARSDRKCRQLRQERKGATERLARWVQIARGGSRKESRLDEPGYGSSNGTLVEPQRARGKSFCRPPRVSLEQLPFCIEDTGSDLLSRQRGDNGTRLDEHFLPSRGEIRGIRRAAFERQAVKLDLGVAR